MVSQAAVDLYQEHILGKVLRGVQARLVSAEQARFEAIHLFVDGYRVSLTPTLETDEIVLDVDPCEGVPLPQDDLHPVLKALIGRVFSWFWVSRNLQGYRDMFTLSFGADVESGALQPYLAFLVEAATIGLHRIKEV